MYVCLFACMLVREIYKEKKTRHPTFEWNAVFAERCQKQMKQYFAVREMLPNKI